MNIEKNRVVSLSYTLKVEDDIIEVVPENRPMEFIFGSGYLLPKFEKNIEGKKIGDSFEFSLAAQDAYGEETPDAIVELPIDMFKVDGVVEEGLLKVGNVLPMQDSDGNKLQGVIDEVRDNIVVMNFNHPLAGQSLHFKGSVVSVREATEHESKYGLKSSNGGCGDSGCSSCCGCE